jgi:hypothetical protein
MRAKQKTKSLPKPRKQRPERLAEKLLEIRQKLGLSQGGMMKRLGEDETKR